MHVVVEMKWKESRHHDVVRVGGNMNGISRIMVGWCES